MSTNWEGFVSNVPSSCCNFLLLSGALCLINSCLPFKCFQGPQGLHQCNVYRRSIFFPKTQRGFILFLLNLLNVVDTLSFWCPPFWRPAKMHLQSRSVKSIPLSLESQFGSAVGTAEWVLGVPFGSTRWSWCATSLALSVTTIFSSPVSIMLGTQMSACESWWVVKMEVNNSVIWKGSFLYGGFQSFQLNKSEVENGLFILKYPVGWPFSLKLPTG